MKAAWLISLSMFSASLAAQVSDTTIWRPFELISNRTAQSTGSLKINLPVLNGGSFADVLSQYSALFVKSYSPGNLASTSMRGMGAQHTAVLWNGVNLQSNMNSNIDLNLLPVFFIDQASVETGANSSSVGNGAIAGAIQVNNRLPAGKAVYGELQYGSFSQRSLALGANANLKNWSINTRFLSKSAENDFTFNNYFLPGKPEEKLRNSKFIQSGFMQELGYKLNKKNRLYANFWYLQTQRQLPPAMGIINTNNERQDDYSTKFLLQHKYDYKKVNLTNRLVFLDEQINYFNDLLSPAYNNSKSYLADSRLEWNVTPELDLFSEINYNYQTAKTDGYRNGKSRHLINLYTGIQWKSTSGKRKLKVGNRQMMSNGEMVPSAPDLGFELKLSKWMKLKGNLAASYRLPSFNDLYWVPGGNAALKPEIGKKAELSTEFISNSFKSGLTVFMHHVNDWILWTPNPSGSVWTANNAKAVSSKGVELSSEFKHAINNRSEFKCFGRYQFVSSINTQVYAADSNSLRKQLFYTPKHTGFLQMQYLQKQFGLSFGAVYTGSRFTTADNTAENVLKGFLLFNASATTQLKIKNHAFSLILLVSNITNKSYQVVENRPMPMRNFTLTLKFNINHE
ncbi:MAG TPA: TonB-dependent receptor [Bacteroidia bacterium]